MYLPIASSRILSHPIPSYLILSIYLYLYLYIYLPTYLSTYLPKYLSVCLFVCLSVCLYIYLYTGDTVGWLHTPAYSWGRGIFWVHIHQQQEGLGQVMSWTSSTCARRTLIFHVKSSAGPMGTCFSSSLNSKTEQELKIGIPNFEH